MPSARTRATRLGLPLTWWALLLLLAAYAAMTLGAPGVPAAGEPALYGSLLAGAVVLCLNRARADRRERSAWIALGAALALWLGGDAARSAGGGAATWDEALALAGYLAACAGLALLLRARVRATLGPTLWLDGAIVATSTASIVAVLAPGEESIADLAPLLGDVVLLTLCAGATALLRRRAGQAFALVAGGLAAYALIDAARLLGAAVPFDALWPLGALLVGAAAALPPVRPRRAALDGRARFALPAGCTLAALALVLYDRHVAGLGTPAVDLALAAPALLLVRLALSLRENAGLLVRSRVEALTDSLTGLGNRRALMEQLQETLEEARGGAQWRLALFDLDGFKRYNDVFGHVAGDVLIEHLGGRLAAAVAGRGLAFRMGGDEFCVLAPADRAAITLARASGALREEGEGFRIDSSAGVVALPDDAGDVESALQLADRRMYAAKELRPASAARQSGDVLLRALGEREPQLLAHTEAVADLARRLAGDLGLDAEARDVVARAAELHDIGKVAIPDAILAKPGPLDGDEQAFMERHTVIGEAIIAVAPALRPVAALVRSSHERWDGRGYPDGLAGEEIPLGARIVAVCDAFSAMLQRRPYGETLDAETALDELRRCAGSQFDPAVVAAFCAVRGQRVPVPASGRHV
jgi:diguanylate cyclase (GGDEF)-like protein